MFCMSIHLVGGHSQLLTRRHQRLIVASFASAGGSVLMMFLVLLSACPSKSDVNQSPHFPVILTNGEGIPIIIRTGCANTEYTGHVRFIEVRQQSLSVEWNAGTQLPEYTGLRGVAIVCPTDNGVTATASGDSASRDRTVRVGGCQYRVLWYARTREVSGKDGESPTVAIGILAAGTPDAWLNEYPLTRRVRKKGEPWEVSLIRTTVIDLGSKGEPMCKLLATGRALVITESGLCGPMAFRLRS